jgi:hypothetical protein
VGAAPAVGPLCFSAEHCSFFGMPSAELLRAHEEENAQKDVVKWYRSFGSNDYPNADLLRSNLDK